MIITFTSLIMVISLKMPDVALMGIYIN